MCVCVCMCSRSTISTWKDWKNLPRSSSVDALNSVNIISSNVSMPVAVPKNQWGSGWVRSSHQTVSGASKVTWNQHNKLIGHWKRTMCICTIGFPQGDFGHHQQTNTLRFRGTIPVAPPTTSEHWRHRSITTFHGRAHHSLTWSSSNLVLSTKQF